MSKRTGFLSRCGRFGMGIGTLSVSRGYGPVSDQVLVLPPPPILHAGGPSAHAIVSKSRKGPPIGAIELEPKKKC